ncbi:hypothetical protein [Chromobacterium amazonense]|uniref:hypothetical protein n=1 Tax=Chromobacterium amazonense TaxID=1382803 RepID=UPI003F79FDF8
MNDALQAQNGATAAVIASQDLQVVAYPSQTLVTTSAVSQYVSNASLGLTLRAQADVVATTPVTLQGLPTLDGVSLQAGQKVLATSHAGAMNTGHADSVLWVAQADHWTRAPEMDGSPYFELESSTLWVMNGSQPALPVWGYLTELDYLQMGNGLSKQGLTLNLKLPANSGLAVNAGPGLDASAAQLNLSLAASRGLAAGTNGLHVQTGAALTVNGNVLQAAANNDLSAGPGASTSTQVRVSMPTARS